MKTLVTGAAGFIGSHVVRALLADGHQVRALHLPGERLQNLAGLDVERWPGDVTDRAAMRAAVQGRDWVFHLAAIYALWLPDPARMDRVNVDGTRILLEVAAAAGVRRFIHTSSIARFGGQGRGRRAREDSPFRLGPTGDRYAASKAAAHEVARAAAHSAVADLDVVIVAPTGPIGPGDLGPTPTGRLLLTAATLPVAVVTDTVSNFGDVRAIARGHVLAAERGRRGECYLLGDRDVHLAELARMAAAILGTRPRVVVAPFWAARLGAHAALAWARRTRRPPLITPAAVAIAELGLAADCSRAVRELGLPVPPLEDALRDALVWFAREGYLDRRLADRVLGRPSFRTDGRAGAFGASQ